MKEISNIAIDGLLVNICMGLPLPGVNRAAASSGIPTTTATAKSTSAPAPATTSRSDSAVLSSKEKGGIILWQVLVVPLLIAFG